VGSYLSLTDNIKWGSKTKKYTKKKTALF